VKYIYTFLFLYSLIGCSKLDEPIFYPCKDGRCDSVFYVDEPKNSYLDNNNYWRVPYRGLKYFTVKGKLDELHEKYVVNGVPLVETIFDSNYWVWINNLSFTIPVYSVLSWFTDREFNNPIPVGEYTIYLTDIFDDEPPLNITGYQITENTCMDCPYTPTLFGSYSKYTYKPQHSFYMDERMVGDSLKVFVKVIFNSDIGERVEMEHVLDIID
jgi:hypothetical protein